MLSNLRNVLNCTCTILEANITAHEILNNYNNQKIIVKLEEYLIRYLSSKDLPHEGRRFSGPWCLTGDCCRHRCRSPRPGGSPPGWSAPGCCPRTSSCCQGPSGWGDAKNKPKDHCKETTWLYQKCLFYCAEYTCMYHEPSSKQSMWKVISEISVKLCRIHVP